MDFNAANITAIAAIAAPIFVAIINNKHQRKLRKMELEYDIAILKLNSLYEDKKKAFSDFLYAAGQMCTDEMQYETELDFYSYTQTSLLFASEENQKLISLFSSEIMRYINTGIPPEQYNVLKIQLSTLAISLNKELSTLRDEISKSNKRK